MKKEVEVEELWHERKGREALFFSTTVRLTYKYLPKTGFPSYRSASAPKYLPKTIRQVHRSGRPILIETASVEESNELAADKFAKLGGLYVIGTNLHECVRIDNQLRGLSGRQGDTGSSKFWVSLEDDLKVCYGIEKALPSYHQQDNQETPLTSDKYQKTLAHIQRVIDGQNVDIRETLTKYADLVEQQRRILYRKRRDILVDKRSYGVLIAREPQMYKRLVEQMGEERLASVKRQITLFEIDQCWADYLEHVAYIREGIHLESISNRNPISSFHNQIIDAYEHILRAIEDKIVSTFRRIDVNKGDFDLEQMGLKRPSSTWTYMINDQLFKRKFSMF